MESKKINQLATELAPDLSDLTIIGDPTTGISKKITLSQMASLFTGTVEEYANLAAFPLVGVADTIYIALDTNILYRWNTGTSAYVELSPNIVSSLVFNDANGFDGTINLVGSVATLTITTALTTGSVGFIGASGALLQDNANFFWDDTNNRLGLGTNAPTTALDVFGSGIIGRLNGTSTNNAFLGFASAGTNKWSIGNVQSDHRFRIYNEATTSELVSVLSTGEFGIGIANPTTKFHIDGAASALIANLDADVSIAKSISFRSDNSNRINLEVSGTESGSNAGANFFIRRYSDAGSLIDTPLTLVRSTGNLQILNKLSVANTNSTYALEVHGEARFYQPATSTTAYLRVENNRSRNAALNLKTTVGDFLLGVGIGADTNQFQIYDNTAGANRLFITSTGIVVIGGTAASRQLQVNTSGNNGIRIQTSGDNPTLDLMQTAAANAGARNWRIVTNWEGWGTFDIQSGTTNTEDPATTRMSINGTNGKIGMGTGSPNGPLDIVGPTYDGKYTISLIDSAAVAADIGGGIYFGGNYTGTTKTGWAGILGKKENATDGQYGGYLSFFTRTNGSSPAERMRIDANGDIKVAIGAGITDTRFLMIAKGDTGSTYAFVVKQSNATQNLFFLRDDGYINTGTRATSPYNLTTASAANMFVDSGGGLNRSTSSIRFKTNVEDLYQETSSLLYKMRPIWYRSLGQNDKKNWSWYGFIAEELALIEPRLVQWGYEENSYETIEIEDKEGNITQETKLKEDAVLIPDGVQYERITVLLVSELQKMRKELDELKAKIK